MLLILLLLAAALYSYTIESFWPLILTIMFTQVIIVFMVGHLVRDTRNF